MSENEYDELGTQLTRTLTEHADVMSGSALGLAEVKGKARSIRRRRTSGAVVAVAAAVAIIVPTIDLASHTGGKPEPAPVTQTPSPTQTASTDGHQPTAGVLDVSDLPTGDRPRMEYVTGGRTLHLPDGGSIDIPTRYPIGSFVALSDGSHLWLTSHQGTPYVEVEDGDGGFREPVPSGWGLSVNQAHTVGAWVRPDGQVMVWNSGATQPLAYGDPISATDDMRMGPILGDHCGDPADSCEVYVNVADPDWQPWLVSVNGTEPYRDGSYLIVADGTDSGLSIGYRSIDDFGSCSVLQGGGEFQGFRTCKHTLASFSPDGELILADPAYHDGIGHGVIGMYDLDGNLRWDRHSTRKAQAFYPTAQWEDAEHALAPVFQDGTWSIVRFATDGSMEYAVPPVPGRDMQNPYVVATS